MNTFTILENYWKKTDFVKNCYIVASASPQYLSISTFYFFLNNYFRRYSQGGQGAHVKKKKIFKHFLWTICQHRYSTINSKICRLRNDVSILLFLPKICLIIDINILLCSSNIYMHRHFLCFLSFLFINYWFHFDTKSREL